MGLADASAGIRDTVNQGYNQFIGDPNIGLPHVINTINANQGAEFGQIGNAATQGASNINANSGAVLASLAAMRQANQGNTRQAIGSVTSALPEALQTFGRTPQTIGDQSTQDYGENLAPSVDRFNKRMSSSLQLQGDNVNRNINYQEADTGAATQDKLNRLQGWKRDKEQQAVVRYQTQRQAIQREMAGADLERHLQLANESLAAAGILRSSLSSINAVTRAIMGGY